MKAVLGEPEEITVEVFPILLSAVPPLTAYRLKLRHGDLATMGGKLASQFAKAFPGLWVWSERHLLTDTPQIETALRALITTLWQEKSDAFGNLVEVKQDETWSVNPQAQADFIARGVISERKQELDAVLRRHTRLIASVQIVREVDVRGWVVDGQPALSMTLSSRVVAKQELKAYASQLTDPKELVGLMVQEKFLHMTGEVVGIAGKLIDNRVRLLSQAAKPTSKRVLQQAADDELVLAVEVTRARQTYDIVISALQIIVRTADYARFQVPGPQALSAMRMTPTQRTIILRELFQVVNRSQPLLRSTYTSSSRQGQFLRAAEVQFQPLVRVGDGNCISADTILSSLHKYGMYSQLPQFADRPLNVGVICCVPNAELVRSDFLPVLRKELEAQRFGYCGVGILREATPTRSTLEKAIDQLQTKQADLILGVFPDAKPNSTPKNAAKGCYGEFKSITVGQGIPSQVVEFSTVECVASNPGKSSYILGNIALGMASKVGNIPYALAKPLPYADIVVGIDIARRRKTQLAGSLNATALARIYQNNGVLLQYAIHDAPLEGETIPDQVLQGLFPRKLFQGKRILIHRDGIFRGNEKQALKAWAQQIGAEIMLVEILKTGTPRLYGITQRIMEAPVKGFAFKLSDYEAFVVSTPPPFKEATPAPLHLRTEPPLRIEEALHSVLSLTLLHYGSLRPPRLPISLHYSDEIAGLILEGIKPKDPEGTLPFWL